MPLYFAMGFCYICCMLLYCCVIACWLLYVKPHLSSVNSSTGILALGHELIQLHAAVRARSATPPRRPKAPQLEKSNRPRTFSSAFGEGCASLRSKSICDAISIIREGLFFTMMVPALAEQRSRTAPNGDGSSQGTNAALHPDMADHNHKVEPSAMC